MVFYCMHSNSLECLLNFILLRILQRHHIRERSLSVVNMFLDEMAKEAKNIITTICDEQCTLQDKV